MDLFATEKIPQLSAECGTPFFMLSKNIIRQQYQRLQKALPKVDIYYSIKAQSDRAVLSCLNDLGSKFDVCSNAEIDLTQDLGIIPQNLMHTHPVKKDHDIQHALHNGCKTFVFDCAGELEKFTAYADQVELVLRLSFRSEDAIVDLSRKFGAQPQDGIELIQKAHASGLKVRGLSFHVGSQNLNPYIYTDAILFCRKVFDQCKHNGIHLDILDIGGGFPITYTERVADIEDFCKPINQILNELFDDHQVICEPGRFIAGPAMQLVSSVVGKTIRQERNWYYLDDGLYGSYSGKVFDHADYPVHLFNNHDPLHKPSVLAGPTCDSFDIIYDNIMLPELAVGDLIVSPAIGAYSSATATGFNLFPTTPIICVDE
ncbi:MAG: type III PLP-dependent enzyme [Planctomycetes bacterium]|nr:type III PLP-dependent enzyme [Planctomycetota bacterium]